MADNENASPEAEFTLENTLMAMLNEGSSDEEDTPEEEGSDADDETAADDEGSGDESPEDGEGQEGEEDLLAKKLEELEKQYGEPEATDDWADVKAHEQFLIAEQQALEKGWEQGLPDIKDDKGVSIYDMEEARFDAFLQELDDDGKERLKVQAVQAREAALKQATEFLKRREAFNEQLQTYNQVKLEMEVITDIAKQLGLPDVVKRYKNGDITRHVAEKAKGDAAIAKKTQTKEGLYQLALMAIKGLGIVKTSAPKETKTPSAPDAKASSKKVRTRSLSDLSDEATLARVSKMSSSEYAKLDRETKDRVLTASILKAI